MSLFSARTLHITHLSAPSVNKLLMSLPQHYHNYRNNELPGRWKFNILKKNQSNIDIQLIDTDFETPRDARSEEPYFSVQICDSEFGCLLMYHIRLRKSLWLSFWIMLIFSVSALIGAIYFFSVEELPACLIFAFIFLFLTILIVFWSARYIKHSKLALVVFESILSSYIKKQRLY